MISVRARKRTNKVPAVPISAGVRVLKSRGKHALPMRRSSGTTFAGAVAHAQQAVNAAPQDAELWFLLGYAARLNGNIRCRWTPTTGD